MARIPEFLTTLEKMKELHLKKNEDYAASDNPFSNFDFTEFVLSQFKNDRDKTFVWPIATKLARLSTLLNSTREPNNESIEDSFDDIAVYIILWKCDFLKNRTMKGISATESARVKEKNHALWCTQIGKPCECELQGYRS